MSPALKGRLRTAGTYFVLWTALGVFFYLPMIYLSGFLIPLPKSVEWIAVGSPAFHLHQLALRAIGAPSHGDALVHLAVLAGVTLLLTAFAVRRLARGG